MMCDVSVVGCFSLFLFLWVVDVCGGSDRRSALYYAGWLWVIASRNGLSGRGHYKETTNGRTQPQTV